MVKKYEALLNELVEDTCDCKYCILKVLLTSIHPDPRMLLQMKCIDKFKFEHSKGEDREICWKEAAMLWIEYGHAERFAKEYNEEDKMVEIYRRTVGNA